MDQKPARIELVILILEILICDIEKYIYLDVMIYRVYSSSCTTPISTSQG